MSFNLLLDNIFFCDDISSDISNFINVNFADFFYKKILIVADKNTQEILAKKLFKNLSSKFSVIDKIFTSFFLKATIENVEKIREIINSEKIHLVIAVGSGTINDICKYAAFLSKIPYIACPTAPSMNGYLAANASIIFSKYKKSVAALPPKAVFVCNFVMMSTPLRLIKSGVADIFCIYTVYTDWFLANQFFDYKFSSYAFENVSPLLKYLHQNSTNLLKREVDSLKILYKSLFLSGFAMTVFGGSQPASQGEHTIAHVFESLCDDVNLNDAADYDDSHSINFLHGEIIAATTYEMAKIQHNFLSSSKIPEIKKISNYQEIIESVFFNNVDLQKSFAGEYFAKLSLIEANKANSVKNFNNNFWRDFVYNSEIFFRDYFFYEDFFNKMEIVFSPNLLGFNQKQYQQSVDFAFLTRNRFTFLDLFDAES